MLRTEEEAKKCWCPFAQLTVNRWSRGDNMASSHQVRCIASECMAWRKGESVEFKYKADALFKRDGVRLVSTEGFCGLAGALLLANTGGTENG